jgi:hypothetical protein
MNKLSLFLISILIVFSTIGTSYSLTSIANDDVYIPALKKLFFDGGVDTYLTETAPNNIAVITGNAKIVDFRSDSASNFFGDVLIQPTKKFRLDGNTAGDTYLTESSPNNMDLFVGGIKKISIGSDICIGIC